MKWLRWAALLAALFIWCGAAAAQTATVSFALKDVGISPVTTANNYVRFELRNYGSSIPRVSGSSALAVVVKDFSPDGSGNISGTIYANDAITPIGTFYRVCVWGNSQQFRCGDYSIGSGTTFNLSSATPISITPAATAASILTQLYVHLQASAATTWTIAHNFGDQNVLCTFFDNATPPQQILPDTVKLTDTNTATATFTVARMGRALCTHAGNYALSAALAAVGAVVTNPSASQTIVGNYTLTLYGLSATTIASSGGFSLTDANGSLLSRVPQYTFTVFAAGNTSGTLAKWLPPSPEPTILNVRIYFRTAPVGCSGNAAITFSQPSVGAIPSWSVVISLAGQDSTATLNQSLTPGVDLTIAFGAATGCSTPPADANIIATMRAQ